MPGLASLYAVEELLKWKRPCAARMLVVADGNISFISTDFGLSRFLEAITDPAAPVQPALTLAHRGEHPFTGTATVRGQAFTVEQEFRFTSRVNIENFDQIWLFGFEGAEPAMSGEEIAVIAEFMNSGGGMFATGDHSYLGRAMSYRLPRIRRMREWENIPMDSTERIDTIVDPGANAVHEFDDQSDDVPMRIYPHYRVEPGAGDWVATVHPVLMLPGAPDVRTRNTDFTKDLDVFPDHAHESVCYATREGDLNDTYFQDDPRLSFPEWQRSSADPSKFIGAEIVASAVSGGRAIDIIGYFKPPVRPQMFGVISAYDGRLAEPYPRKEIPPGRILCDSTWHHYVNANLDGGSYSGRTGLGTGRGPNFVPSADLEKIYVYYRNVVAWLQPANRVWCDLFWRLIDTRWNPSILEELENFERPEPWIPLTGFGKTVVKLLSGAGRPAAAQELVLGLLVADPETRRFAAVFQDRELLAAGFDRAELVHGIFGGLMLKLAEIVPANDRKKAEAVLSRGAKGAAKEMLAELHGLVRAGIEHQLARADKLAATLRDKRFATN